MSPIGSSIIYEKSFLDNINLYIDEKIFTLYNKTITRREREAMTNQPLVSVIVPVWQGEKTLAGSVSSLLRQSCDAIEILIVNDGSTDGSLDIAESFAQKDSRVRVLTQENMGVSAARNLGLSEARGKYVCFCDSDDWVYPKAIETLLGYMQAGCGLAVGGFEAVLQQKSVKSAQFTIPMQIPSEEYLKKLCKRANCMYFSALWNKMYDLDIIRENELQFSTELSWGEDFTFNMLYLRHINTVGVTDQIVYRYIRSIGGQAISALFAKRGSRASNFKTKRIMQLALQGTMAQYGLEKKYALMIATYYVSVTLLE